MSIFYKIENDIIIVYGKTFDRKDDIKAIGGQFNYVTKYWTLSANEHNLANVARLCGVDSVDTSEIYDVETSTKSQDLKISELIAQVSLAVKRSFPMPVWVVGEVQNVAVKKNGIYFELAEPKEDEGSVGAISVKAVMWRSAIKLKQNNAEESLNFDQIIADGIKIRALCSVDIYKDRGVVSLTVVDIDPSYTKGVLALQREKLLKELKKAGVIDNNKMLALTDFPFKVGLITADGSRAKSDFIDQLQSYAFCGEVVFVPSQMQGDKTSDDVCSAIDRLCQLNCDIIVITRGGGSSMDLRYFDDPKIAYAIVNSLVPIVAAIGHHDDVCVAEIVAYRREKTPTAAADFVLSCFESTREKILDFSEELESSFLVFYDRMISDNKNLLKTVIRYALLNLESQGRSVELHKVKLIKLTTEYILSKKNEILELERNVIAKDPKPWLAEGWTRVYLESGKMLDSVKQTKLGDKAKIRLLDGTISVVIDHVEEITHEKK